MKKAYFLIGLSIPILFSMTFKEASSKTASSLPKIVYSVPIKPKSTIIVDGFMKSKYLKKGYQVQQMVHTPVPSNYGAIKLLMVKY